MKIFEEWYSKSTRQDKDDIVLFFEENLVDRRRIIMLEPKDPLWKKINGYMDKKILVAIKPGIANSTGRNTWRTKTFINDIFLIVEDLYETKEPTVAFEWKDLQELSEAEELYDNEDYPETEEFKHIEERPSKKIFYYFVIDSIESEIFEKRGQLASRTFTF